MEETRNQIPSKTKLFGARALVNALSASPPDAQLHVSVSGCELMHSPLENGTTDFYSES